MNDFCHISLSDLMTPWEMIEKRLHAAAQGDHSPYKFLGVRDVQTIWQKIFLSCSEYKSEDTIVGNG